MSTCAIRVAKLLGIIPCNCTHPKAHRILKVLIILIYCNSCYQVYIQSLNFQNFYRFVQSLYSQLWVISTTIGILALLIKKSKLGQFEFNQNNVLSNSTFIFIILFQIFNSVYEAYIFYDKNSSFIYFNYKQIGNVGLITIDIIFGDFVTILAQGVEKLNKEVSYQDLELIVKKFKILIKIYEDIYEVFGVTHLVYISYSIIQNVFSLYYLMDKILNREYQEIIIAVFWITFVGTRLIYLASAASNFVYQVRNRLIH